LNLLLARRRPIPPLPTRERRGSALEALSPTAAGQFQSRARLYAALDSRLQSKTRFFGAACVTNRVLAHWASMGAVAHAGLCADWLSELGAALESVNRSIAAAVHNGDLTGPELDERIVFIEQSVVETSLRRARASQTQAYLNVLPALDALLNHESWLSAWHFSPAVRWYRRVLAGAREELRSPFEFARQCHREKIGMALIVALRRGE
jgi:hypothetical protein